MTTTGEGKRALSERERSHLKLLQTLRSQGGSEGALGVVRRIAAWIDSEVVLAYVAATRAWLDDWGVKEALLHNDLTPAEVRREIEKAIAIFELLAEIDRGGLEPEERSEIQEDVRDLFKTLSEHDREIVRARARSLSSSRAARRPGASVTAPLRSPAEGGPEAPARTQPIAARPAGSTEAVSEEATPEEAAAEQATPEHAAPSDALGASETVSAGPLDPLLAEELAAVPTEELQLDGSVTGAVHAADAREATGAEEAAAPDEPATTERPPHRFASEDVELAAELAERADDVTPAEGTEPIAEPSPPLPAPPGPAPDAAAPQVPSEPAVAPDREADVAEPVETEAAGAVAPRDVAGLDVTARAERARTTTESSVLDALCHDRAAEVLLALVANPALNDRQAAVIARRAPAKVAGAIWRRKKLFSRPLVREALLQCPNAPSAALLEIVGSINDVAGLMKLIRSPSVRFMEVKAKARAKLTALFRSMGPQEKLVALRRAGRGVVKELWTDFFRDEELVLRCVREGAVDTGTILDIARSRMAPRRALEAIGTSARHASNYDIKLQLVLNPKTPRQVAARLLRQLNPTDRRMVKKNQTVPESLRRLA